MGEDGVYTIKYREGIAPPSCYEYYNSKIKGYNAVSKAKECGEVKSDVNSKKGDPVHGSIYKNPRNRKHNKRSGKEVLN